MDRNCLTESPGKKPFTLMLFDDYEFAQGAQQRLVVKSIEEAAYLMRMLGKHAEIFISKETRTANAEFADWAEAADYSDFSSKTAWPEEYNQTLANLLETVPIYNELTKNTELVFFSDDCEKNNEPCAKELVHKTNRDNVMLSQPVVLGSMCHFNILRQRETPEIQIDHTVEHVRALNTFEAIRQAGVATQHILGTPLDAKLTINSIDMHYSNFIELGAPIAIRTIHYKPEKTGSMYSVWVAFQICQHFQQCVQGLMTGSVCLNDRLWQKFRQRAKRNNAEREKAFLQERIGNPILTKCADNIGDLITG